jgi:hypothetical protein
MSTEESLIDQHIREYESRMRHIDQMLERAQKGLTEIDEAAPVHNDFKAVKQEREKLATLYDELKLPSTEDWRREEIIKSGPMGIWDSLAQQLEKLVERLER